MNVPTVLVNSIKNHLNYTSTVPFPSDAVKEATLETYWEDETTPFCEVTLTVAMKYGPKHTARFMVISSDPPQSIKNQYQHAVHAIEQAILKGICNND